MDTSNVNGVFWRTRSSGVSGYWSRIQSNLLQIARCEITTPSVAQSSPRCTISAVGRIVG